MKEALKGLSRSVNIAARVVPLLLLIAAGLFLDASTASGDPPASTWTVASTPSLPDGGNNALNGVSCVSSSYCIAVGSNGVYPDLATLAEEWDGSSWTVLLPPDASASDFLQSVSCLSTTFCMAVGQSEGTPLTELWDGSTWTIEDAPPVGPGIFTALNSISCTSTQFCAAVGEWSPGSLTGSVMEIWDGTTWSLSSPLNGNEDNLASQLDSVSCTSASFCLGVGVNSSAVTWGGSSWSEVSGTPPANELFSGVSCESDIACTIVGAGNGSGTVSLIENWNGTSWTSTTPPAGPAAYALNQLSCVQSTCVAVGSTNSGTIASYQPVVVTESDGSWDFVGSPGVPSSPGSLATAVSCVQLACVSTGQTDNTSATDTQTFAMMAPFNLMPSVAAVSPSTGPTSGGTSVTISGTNFSSTPGAVNVSFGAVAATDVSCTSSTQCTATSPAGSAGIVDVTVTVGGLTSPTSSADQFTYVTPPPTPTVTGVSPSSGPSGGGTAVTISGTNFSSTPGAVNVSFGAVAATDVSCTSSTQCTATSPAGSAGIVDVTVTEGARRRPRLRLTSSRT